MTHVIKIATFIILIWPGVKLTFVLERMSRIISQRYAEKLEFYLYLGLLQWIAISKAMAEQGSWWVYLSSASVLLVSQVPVLLYSWKSAPVEGKFASGFREQSLWFGLYLPLLALVSQLPGPWLAPLRNTIFLGCLASLSLHVILLMNHHLTQWVFSRVWVQRLSLEKSVFISLSLIALILSAMAVSSLGLDRYDTAEQLLIGFEFNAFQILSRFPTFLSYAAQLLLMYLCGYLLFVLNNRLLVAQVLRQRGLLLYLLSCLAVVGLLYPFMAELLTRLPLSQRLGGLFSKNPFVWENAFAALMILLLSLPLLLAMQWSKQRAALLLLEKEKTQAELDLLKQQLNPHFFFNTLNNLYALSLQQSPHTPEVVLELSDLMRYVLYTAQQPYVAIDEEVDYLRHYLHLQSIRLKDEFDLTFTVQIQDETFLIAPLLLIVLMENAFKHGIEPAGGSGFLRMSLRIDSNRLYFRAENSFVGQEKSQPGIGLSNLQKRLELLYPGRHRLQFYTQENLFKAELELENAAHPLFNR